MSKSLVFVVLLFTQVLKAEDVYNFYFQKAPGPQTVIQGGTTKASDVPVSTVEAVAPAAKPEATTATTPAARVESTKNYKTWEFIGGYGLVSDELDRFKGFSVAGNYNFNKYVGIGAALTYANDPVDHYYKAEDAYGRAPLDVALGLTVTPIHIRVFGFDFFEIGVLGGYMTKVTMRDDHSEATRELVPYVGPRFALNFSENVGVVTDYRLLYGDDHFGQMTTGLRVRF